MILDYWKKELKSKNSRLAVKVIAWTIAKLPNEEVLLFNSFLLNPQLCKGLFIL